MLSTVQQIVMVLILTQELLATSLTVMDLCLDLMENMNWILKIINVQMVIVFMDCQSLAPARTTAEEVK